VSRGKIVGSLTLRDVIQAVVRNGGSLGDTMVRTMMDDCPLTCSPETELDEVRRRSRRRRTRRAVGGWWCARIGARKAAGGTRPSASAWIRCGSASVLGCRTLEREPVHQMARGCKNSPRGNAMQAI